MPETELLDVAGLAVLAVKRYDRLDAPTGDIPVRVHQEDGCQATATPPGLKYEEQGGPGLRDFATVIRNFGDPREVTSLLRRTTFNMAVGNADAHAKNFSVLHEVDVPAIRLAPLYDVLSTIALELTDSAGQPVRADTHPGQRVGGQADVRRVTSAKDGVVLMNAWHFPREIAVDRIAGSAMVVKRREVADGIATFDLVDGRRFTC